MLLCGISMELVMALKLPEDPGGVRGGGAVRMACVRAC